MEVGKKSIHKPAFFLAIAGLIVSGALAYMINFQPQLASNMISAMFTQNFKIIPNKKGFASIEIAKSNSGLGSATSAGDRFNDQMNFLSSAKTK